MNDIISRHTKTLKEALYDTIHYHDSLTVEAIAEQLGMTKSYLYRSAMPDPDTDGEQASGVRFPLKQLVPLTRTTGDFQALDVIEYQLGRVAIPLPKRGSINKVTAQDNALTAMVEFGQLIEEVQMSLADGKINEEEQQRIEKEGCEAIQAILLLINSRRNL